MSREIATHLSIDEREVPHFVSIRLAQRFSAHHDFEVVLNGDELLGGGHTHRSALDHIGKFVVISFGGDSPGDNVFRGIVTGAGLRKGDGRWAHLVLRGHGPTVLLEGGGHFDSHTATGLADLVRGLCSNMAADDLNLVARPAFKGDIAYTCQYGESHFRYLCRLAAEHGEWFYYDGQNLFFGRPQAKAPLALLYGERVQETEFLLHLVPTRVEHYGYDAAEDELSTSDGGRVQGANGYMAGILDTGDRLYRKTMVRPTLLDTGGQAALDRYAKQRKGQRAAGTVALRAKGDDPRVVIGGLIRLTVQEHPLSGKGAEEGEYLVTSIEHHLTGTGAYWHSFEAIPSANDHVPMALEKPVARNQVATVTDNADPMGMGRVKVRMQWQSQKSTDWVRVLSQDAGSDGKGGANRGHLFVPEVGDQVLVGFRHGDPDRPIVLGGLFHGKNGKGGGKDNNTKSIRTRSGHTIEFDDTGKGTSLTIKDPAGNTILLDTSGKNITITAPETMTFKAKNMVLDIDENMTCGIGKDMKTTIGANHTLSIKEKYELSSSETKESVDEDKSVTIKGDLKVQTASTKWSAKEGDLHFESAATAILQGKSDAKLNKG